MSWDYQYVVGTSTSDAVALTDYCTAVLIETEAGGGKTGTNLRVGYVDGERFEPKTYAPLDIVLKTVLRYTDKDGAVNHTDDEAGHVFQNLSELKLLLGSPGLKYLIRDTPDYGLVRAEFEMISPPIPGEQRHVFYWPLRIPSGSWQDAAASTATGTPPSVTTKGNRRIHDPQIVFSAAGTLSYTAGDGSAYSVTAAAGPTFPVTLTFNNGEWGAVDDAAADALPYITVSHPAVMVLDPDKSLSLSASAAVTVNWRNRWA